MGEVININRRSSPPPDMSISKMHERMRHAEVEEGLRHLLDFACRPHPRLAMRIERDGAGRMTVIAIIDGRTPFRLGSPIPQERMDDFAGVVRSSLHRWIETLSQRAGMRCVD